VTLNIHHLELFYYVAKHGGISQAVRHIPYGIQQPAVSGQILQLESHLGLSLFQRRPFILTSEGKKLYAFIQSFFSNLTEIEKEICGKDRPSLNISASSTVLRDYLPDILFNVRKDFPDLRLELRAVTEDTGEQMVYSGQIDAAISPSETPVPSGLKCEPLGSLPLVFLVAQSFKIKCFEDIIHEDHSTIPIISLPENEMVARLFKKGFEKRKYIWNPQMEASSLDVLRAYAARGFGAGASIAYPGNKQRHDKVRVIPLPDDFPRLNLRIVYKSLANKPLTRFIDLVKQAAATLLT